jgi:predicted ATP-binding protein involved in virulence
VLGYGATRRIGQPEEDIGARHKSVHPRFQRVQSLFEEGVSLIPLGWSLPQIANAGRRKQVVNLIDQLVGDFYKFEGRIEHGQLFFKRGKAHVPMDALSDGFRAFIAWIGDMLHHICTGCPAGKKLTENEGVVLVDEIDLHLHPEWQQHVIRTLSKTFPKIQFIFTSHSPLVTASLEWGNVWVMEESGPRQLPDEPIHGLSADQILQSPYFALNSARPPEVAEKLRTLNQRAQSGDRSAAVEFMQRLAHGSEAPGAGHTNGANSHAKNKSLAAAS